MAQSKRTGMALRVPGQVSRDPGLAFEIRGIVNGRAHGSTTRSGSHSKSAFRAIFFLVLLVIAICLPIVGRSVHVPEGAEYASKSSDGLGARAPSMSDSRMLRSGIVASSRLRSLLANRSVSADLVPALREALVFENTGPVDSLRVMARSPLRPVAAQPLQETDSDSWFVGSPTRPKEAVASESRLARLTTYWPEEGDSYTKRGLSSTGVRLRDGHCAVDPKVIPYGSVVAIPGVGEFVAVDTGPAVVSRRAARQFGRNPDERRALVVDVYCSSRSEANAFEASAPEFAVITWSR